MELVLVLAVFAAQGVWAEGQTKTKVHTGFVKEGSYAMSLTRAHLHLPMNLSVVSESFFRTMNTVKALKMTLEERPGKLRTLPEAVRLTKALDELTALVRKQHDEFAALSVHTASRQKRQFLAAAAGAGSLMSIGLSIYNSYQIEQLSNQLAAQNADIRVLKETVEDVAHVTNRIVVVTNALNSTVVKISDTLRGALFELFKVELFIEVETHLRDFATELRALTEAINGLYLGKLSSNLIDWPQVEKYYVSLQRKAATQRLYPLYSEFGWLLNSPHSFYMQGAVLHLVMHLPFYANELVPLYRHVSLPIIPENYTDGVAVIIEPKHRYIAIGGTSYNGKLLSEAEFRDCEIVQLAREKVFVCTGSNLIDTKVDRTCLGKLFKGDFDWKSLTASCEIKLGYPEAQFFAISDDEVLIFSPHETEIKTECVGSNELIIEKLKGINVKKVRTGCQIMSAEFVFFPQSPLVEATGRWKFFPYELSDDGKPFDWNVLNDDLSELLVQKKLEQVSLSEFETHQWAKVHSVTGLSASAIAVLLVIAVIIFLAVLYVRARRLRRAKKMENFACPLESGIPSAKPADESVHAAESASAEGWLSRDASQDDENAAVNVGDSWDEN